MLSFLDQALSLPAVIWLFVAVFLVHDAEEIATAGWWVNTCLLYTSDAADE